MILLVDNYDSFTWNLYQAMAALGVEVRVVRNDVLDADGLLALEPAAIVLSPGPGRPEGAGVCLPLLERAPDELPVLGVCLGHQSLVVHAGGQLAVDPVPTHGKASLVHHEGEDLLADLPNPFQAGRYHSLHAQRDDLPASLQVTAWTADGVVMAVRDVARPRFGLQFHPESLLTPRGDTILARFLSLAGAAVELAR